MHSRNSILLVKLADFHPRSEPCDNTNCVLAVIDRFKYKRPEPRSGDDDDDYNRIIIRVVRRIDRIVLVVWPSSSFRARTHVCVRPPPPWARPTTILPCAVIVYTAAFLGLENGGNRTKVVIVVDNNEKDGEKIKNTSTVGPRTIN